MRRLFTLSSLIVSGLCGAICCSAAAANPTTNPTTQPTADHPVVFWSQRQSNPLLSMYFVKVDLTNPKVHVRVSLGGPDPDGKGQWLTTLMIPTEIAAREKFDVCVNASFFSAENTKDAEGVKSGYVEGKKGSPNGGTVVDGKLLAAVTPGGVAFWIDDKGLGHLTPSQRGFPKDVVQQAAQGNAFVLTDGKPVDFGKGMMNLRHPRTVVGLDAEGKTLTLMVVDGRNPLRSIGMTGNEEGQAMLDAGCTVAANLDGGGSTELVMRDDDGKLQIINHPSDLRERAVADVIGVSVDGTLRAEEKH